MAFDELDLRAIRAHDLARELPPSLWTEVLKSLVSLLPAGGSLPCVDVGVGTGAVAGRLAGDFGLPVVGVDASWSMLQAFADRHVPVAVGDAVALPLAGGRAGLVTMANLLHLVVDWRAALAEAVRVLAPGGGVLAATVGGEAGRSGVGRYFREVLEGLVELPPMPGPGSAAALDEAMVSLGCEVLPVVHAAAVVPRTIDEFIFRLEWNPFGWPPGVPRWALAEAASVTRAWAADHGDVHEPSDVEVTLGFRVFRRD